MTQIAIPETLAALAAGQDITDPCLQGREKADLPVPLTMAALAGGEDITQPFSTPPGKRRRRDR